jgi:hypothetical protein
MKKICSGCNEERDAENDFSWKNKSCGIRQRWCKFCQAEANKIHYQNNKQIYDNRDMLRNTRVNIENKRLLCKYLKNHHCVDCGCSDIRVLEFDHVSGTKLANIAKMINKGIPWFTIEAEIAKCEVRCANCHRIKTSERGNHWRFGLSDDIAL